MSDAPKFYKAVAGEPLVITFTVLNGGSPLADFADYSARIQLKDKANGRLIGIWDDESPEIDRTNSAAKVKLAVPASVTLGWRFNIGIMDLLMINDPLGRRSKVVEFELERGTE